MDRPGRSADEIRTEMRLTRERATAEIGQVVDGARDLVDWRAYPRRFPWMTLGVAAMAGYAAVPRCVELRAADVRSLQNIGLGGDHPLLLDTRGGRLEQRGMLGALLVAAGTAALRIGLSAAAREIGRRLQPLPRDRSEEPPA